MRFETVEIPETATTAENVNIKFVVANYGAASAQASKAYIYNGSKKIGTVNIAALAVNKQATYSYTIDAGKLKSGKRKIKIVLDGNKKIAELNEKNNTSTATIKVEKFAPDTASAMSLRTTNNNSTKTSSSNNNTTNLTTWQTTNNDLALNGASNPLIESTDLLNDKNKGMLA